MKHILIFNTLNKTSKLLKYTIMTSVTLLWSTAALAHDRIVSNTDNLVVSDETFSDLEAYDGGAIDTSGSYVSITNNEFSYNSASNSGGAIHNSGKNTTINNNTFTSNSAEENGGAIFNINDYVYDTDVSGNTFTNNTARRDGGAIYNSGANIVMDNNTFTSNTASNNGGAIKSYTATSGVGNSTFSSNHAGSNGGAIFLEGYSNNITDNDFDSNEAYVSGGAIFIGNNADDEGNNYVTSNTFTSNSASISGGAIYNEGIDTYMGNNTFTSNYAGDHSSAVGGGAIFNSGTHASVNNNEFNYNSASNYGGAIYNSGADVTITDSNFTYNSADNGGGAIYNTGSSASITNNTFSSNSVSIEGGAIYNSGTTASITDNKFNENNAGTGGAIRTSGAYASITNNEFNFNTAYLQGGAIRATEAYANIENNKFNSNEARFGGAINISSENASISNNEFTSNSSSDGSGGAIESYGAYTSIANNKFNSNNSHTGGAILASGAYTSIANNEFSSNSATTSGGAINAGGRYASITNNKFSANEANIGGAIFSHVIDVNALIENNEFTSNSANESGGAIHTRGENASVVNNEFSSNTAQYGGAVYNSGANATISDNEFTSNTAGKHGGAIYNRGTDVTITDSNFTYNSASNYGGGIYNSGTAYVSSSNFTNNSGSFGGAIYNHATGMSQISSSDFTNNSSEFTGGAIFNYNTAYISSSNFTNNSAEYSGGAIENIGTAYISSSNFTNNSANDGGAISNSGSNLTITASKFTNNSASNRYGGAIKNSGDNFTISNSEFISNSASVGGAIYTTKDITIVADNGTSTFRGNYINNDEADNEAIYVDNPDATVTFRSLNEGNHYMYDYINGTDGYKVAITGDGTGTMHLYNNIKNADVTVDNTTLDINTSAVNMKNVTFAADSVLALTVNSPDEHGMLTAETITVDEGAKLKATLNQGAATLGKTNNVQLLKANNENFNNFADEFDNNMYHFEKTDKNGTYNISLVKTAEDVAIEIGAEPWAADATGAWVDGNNFAEGTTSADVANKLADLAQNNATGLVEAVKALAPTETEVIQATTIEQTNRVTQNIDSHLRGQYNPRGFASGDRYRGVNVWGQAYIGESKISDRGTVAGSKADFRGAMIGVEKRLDRTRKTGFGLQYDSTDISALNRNIDVNSLTGFIYGEYKPSRWFMTGIASYGRSKYDETKYALGTHFDAKYDIDIASVAAMTGYQFRYFTPEMGLKYYHIMSDGYTDTAGQSIKDDKEDILRGVIGILMAKNFGLLKPEVYLGMTYDIASGKNNTTVNLANGSSYTVMGKRLDRLGYETSASITAPITNRLSASIAYMGAFRKNYREHTGMLKVKYNF